MSCLSSFCLTKQKVEYFGMLISYAQAQGITWTAQQEVGTDECDMARIPWRAAIGFCSYS